MIVRDASSSEHIAASVNFDYVKATQLFAASGQDLAALRASALSRDFQPLPLKASIAVSAKNEVREIESNTWVMHTKSTPRDDSARLVAGRQ
jgi:hypothetical protein